MIKLVRESILKGPSEREIERQLKNKNYTVNEKLIYSASSGYMKGVQESLMNGADIHYDDDGALRWASLKGRLSIVDYLVENGADIHAENDEALRWASSLGHLNIVDYLMQNGADLKALRYTSVKNAALNGRMNVLKYFIENFDIPKRVLSRILTFVNKRYDKSKNKSMLKNVIDYLKSKMKEDES